MKHAILYATLLALFASHATAEPQWNGGPPLCFEMSVHNVFESTIDFETTTASTSITPITFADAEKIYRPTTEPGALITATADKAIWQWNGGEGSGTEFELSFDLTTFSNVDELTEENTFGLIAEDACPPDGDANTTGITMMANRIAWQTGGGRGRLLVGDGQCIAIWVRVDDKLNVTTISTAGISFYMRQISTATKPCQ